MSVENIRARLTAPVANLWLKLDRQLFALSPLASRLLAILVIAASALMGVMMFRLMAATAVMPAMAQQGASDVQQVLCSNTNVPIGTLIGFGLAAISMFLLVKAIIQGTVAFNKLGSSRAQQQFEGKQALAGAGKTAAGAFVPPIFAAVVTSLLGVNLADCITDGIEGGVIFTTALASLPF